MKGKYIRVAVWSTGLLAILLLAGLASAFTGRSPQANAASAGNSSSAPTQNQPVVPQATPGQDFQDVFPSNGFYTFLHNLYQAGVVGGYTCGPADPCVPPDNLPYYHPGANVTRLQMTKFIDLARQKIGDATGNSLVISTHLTTDDLRFNTASGSTISSSLYLSTTAYYAAQVNTNSGGYAVYGGCVRAGNNCYAVTGAAAAGDYAGVFSGGKGTYSSSSDASYPSIAGHATGATAYGAQFQSDQYTSLHVQAPPAANGWVQLWVDGTSNTLYAQGIYNGALYVQGNLAVGGSKSGYVVDAMQNASTATLEPGDVVTIVGSGAPVWGEIPVVTVRKADTAYDTGVAGVVDQVLYVPDAATKAAYEAQEGALRAAEQARAAAEHAAGAMGKGAKADYSGISMPAITITDEQGMAHAIEGATQVPTGGYANVVTLGSYKAVKVDASFGPIHAGDLLVASTHAGYAMKGSDRSLTSGATIGKALANLETGTGLIPVMVTLK